MGLLVVPILAMMGLFAWAGAQSSAGSPVGLAQAFVHDFNVGNCQAAIGLIGESPLHTGVPSCRGFSSSLHLTSCTYRSAPPPGAAYSRRLAGYSDLQTVDVTCRASENGLTIPLALEFVTGVRASTGQTLIIDFREVSG